MSFPGKWMHLLMVAVLALTACTVEQEDIVLHSEADFPGRRLGVLTGTVYEMELEKRQDLEPLAYASLPDAIDALRKGRVEALVLDEYTFSPSELSRLGIHRAFCIDTAYTTAFAFKKGDTTLVNVFNRFLEELKASGEFDRITDYWIHSDEIDPATYPEVEAYTEGVPLRYGNTETQPPMAFFVNGQWQGLEIELCRRFAAYLQRPLEIRLIDIPSRLLHLQMGKADLIGGSIFITEERQRQVDFGEPYSVVHPACFVLAEPEGQEQSALWVRGKNSVNQNFVVENRWRMILDGLLTTLDITIASILLGSLLGLLLCGMAMSRRKGLRTFVRLYDTFMHGIPKLVLLLLMFYVVLSWTGWGAKAIAIATFSLHFASAAGRVLRLSIESVPDGQREAGLAIGLTPAQTFLHIIWPQAIHLGLPHFKGECIALLKDTSIVGFIAIIDITRASDLLRSRSFDSVLPFLVVTVAYFVVAWGMGLVLSFIANGSRNK